MKLASASIALALCLGSAHVSADTVTDWNQTLVEVMLAEKSNPLQQSRSSALMHAAMFEAVNSIERRYLPYRQTIEGVRGASADAAAAVAAHRSLLALYPRQKPVLDEALARSIDGIEAQSMADGAAVGEKAAAQLLQLRAGDGSQDTSAYAAQSARGAWLPTPGVPALGVRWGAVTPWVMKGGSQFRPGPPPDLASEQFRRDYLEVKEVGAKASTTRTTEQTQLANFWIASGPVLWSQPARQLSAARRLSPVDSARAFALLHMAGADALTACWDAKYTYHNFRPITAIRTGIDRLPADPGVGTGDPDAAVPRLRVGARVLLRRRGGRARSAVRLRRDRAGDDEEPDRARRRAQAHALRTHRRRSKQRAHMGRHPLAYGPGRGRSARPQGRRAGASERAETCAVGVTRSRGRRAAAPTAGSPGRAPSPSPG